eukprot:GGOE01018187.1.p1 GENE.GGOE01018187.1~~GGOE01018187.1.p1  ORF type:complete len:704 (-),score=232.83 GGOE01018187.1:290-2401(-)
MTEVQVDPRLEAKFNLIRSVGEECVTDKELRSLVEKKPNFRLYDGFEPSGRMHIAQGVFKAMNVNKCTRAGGHFVFWVADWFALMNDKMGGDLNKIKTVGKYLIEVWKATGMDMQHVEFVWSSDEINKNAKLYWTQALDVARRFTVARLMKCCQIMGRKEGNLTAAQILYPLMQCTDIFFLKADVCQLGVDQRKVNMLARDYCDVAGRKLKPVILSHHMLYGLKKGQEKMSKSDPDSAIFMEDTAEDVKRKIGQAYCPRQAESSGNAEGEDGLHLVEDSLKNPCLDYIEHILFSKPDAHFSVGGTTFSNFDDVKDAFLSEKLSEAELKDGLILAVNELLEPVRQHFQTDGEAKALLETIMEWKKAGQLEVVHHDAQNQVPDVPKCAVYCPLPKDPLVFFSLSNVLLTTRQLQSVGEGSTAVLYLPDWSAFVCNCLGGEESAIRAAFALFVGILKVRQPDVMQKVQVVWQSDLILSNPNNYWITVINVGRSLSLKRVRSVLGGEQEEEAQKVHDVIMPLMHVSDLVSLGATSVVCTKEDEGLQLLGLDYTVLGKRGLTIRCVDHSLPLLKNNGVSTDAECHVSCLDNEMEVNSKLKKKAFCEAQNVTFCPPLTLVTDFILPLMGKWDLERKDSDGGPKTYSTAGEVVEDFKSGSLHPADLKTSVAKALNDFLAPIREHLKKDAEAKKAAAEFDKCLKKLAKGKK